MLSDTEGTVAEWNTIKSKEINLIEPKLLEEATLAV